MRSNLIHHHDKIELVLALEFLPTQITAVQAACWIELTHQKTLPWKIHVFLIGFLIGFDITYQSFFVPCDITMRTTNFDIFEIKSSTKVLIPAFASCTVTFSLRLNFNLNLWDSIKVFSIVFISESVPSRFESGLLYKDNFIRGYFIIFSSQNINKLNQVYSWQI